MHFPLGPDDYDPRRDRLNWIKIVLVMLAIGLIAFVLVRAVKSERRATSTGTGAAGPVGFFAPAAHAVAR